MPLRNDYLNLFKLIGELKNANGTAKWAYAASKNLKIIYPLFVDFMKMNEPTQSFKEFDNARIQLCLKYTEKDKEGNAIIENGNYKILEKYKDKFLKELENLKQLYPQALLDQQKQVEDAEKFLSEEIKIELHKIKIADSPNLTPSMYEVFELMVDESDSKIIKATVSNDSKLRVVN